MLPLNALPLNTLGIIIGLSILIPSILTIIFMRIKKFEELGMVIGIFLIVLSIVTFFYLIPQEIVGDTTIPEGYIWEDEGDVYYWEKNSVISTEDNLINLPPRLLDRLSRREPIEKNFKGKEVIYITEYDHQEKQAIINDVMYDDKGEIFSVINGQEKISEWYGVNTHLKSLEYYNVDAGRMGIPANSKNLNHIRVGWVESNGEREGTENIVLIRDMKRIRTGYLNGVEFCVWESIIYNKPITWHGESYICDETLRLIVEPRTGYIISVYRHLILSAHLSRFFEIYYPEYTQNKVIDRLIKIYDPIGEAAELIYETTEESRDKHIAEVKGLDLQLTFIPIIAFIPMLLIGIAFLWRYGGRSYYWKRYKEFEGIK